MPYEEEQLLEKPLDKKKHRNFSQDNLAATNTKQDYDEEEDLEYDSDETSKDNVLLFPTIH